jgi:hypothetical protein
MPNTVIVNYNSIVKAKVRRNLAFDDFRSFRAHFGLNCVSMRLRLDLLWYSPRQHISPRFGSA